MVMLAPDRVATFMAVVVTLIAVPGPSVLFVVSRGVALGRSAAVSTAVGNEAGLLVQVVLVAFGLGSVVERSLLVFSVLKFAGALYLIYLGVQAWRHRKRLAVEEVGQGRAPMRLRRVLRDGFVVGVTNPKGLLIFSAVLPQFVDPAAGHIPGQLLVHRAGLRRHLGIGGGKRASLAGPVPAQAGRHRRDVRCHHGEPWCEAGAQRPELTRCVSPAPGIRRPCG